jgi:hypothetical protein
VEERIGFRENEAEEGEVLNSLSVRLEVFIPFGRVVVKPDGNLCSAMPATWYVRWMSVVIAIEASFFNTEGAEAEHREH